jgi:hypothetical protein
VSIGGLAGGEKFIIESILFKFAIDTEGIFGGDELASYKNAGQELLCLNAYSNLTVCFCICVEKFYFCSVSILILQSFGAREYFSVSLPILQRGWTSEFI